MNTTINAIPLPDDMQWLDEFAPKVIQQLKTSLDGTPNLIAMGRTNGLPITLSSWSDGAFITRTTVLLLQALADQAGLVMPLVLRDQTFSVMFRHHEQNAFTAESVKQIANPGSDDLYRITLNLITV